LSGQAEIGKGMAKPAFIIFMATVIGGGCNYLYQIFMGRALGTSLYSELAAVISMLLIVSIPTQTVSTMLVRYVSKFKAESKGREMSWLVRATVVYMLIIATVTGLVIFLAIPFLVSFLNLSSDTSLIILIAGLFVSMVYPIGIGTAQGLQRFNLVGVSNIAGPLGKLIFGLLLVYMGFGVAGAFGGVVVGSGLALIISYISIRDIFHGKTQKFQTSDLKRYMIPVTIAVLCFTVLTNVDIFLARHYLSDFDSGLYSAASNLGKIILFLPGAIGAVMFPKISDAHAKGLDTYPIMRKSIIWTLVVSGLVALFYYFEPGFIINLLYGTDYEGASSALAVIGIAMTMFGLATLFMNYGLATDSNALIMILAFFSVLEVALIVLFNSTPLQIAIDLLISSAGICIMSYLHLELRHRSNKR
jgi:O-antigen/teichoic acid export membrane protein